MMTASLRRVAGYVHRLAQGDARGRADHELLDRFVRERDEAAFAELVRRHGPMVLAVGRRVLQHHHDAEDVVQAAFLVLARTAGAIRSRESLGGWLHQVALRLAVRARLMNRRRRCVPLPDHGADGVRPPTRLGSPGGDECGTLLLDEEVQRLPEQFRAVVILCYLEGRTQREAAALLATTAGAVNSRLRQARNLLRRRLRGQSTTLVGAMAPAALAPLLTAQTVQAALGFIAHPALSCGASAQAVTLAKGVMFTMALARIKLSATLAAVAALLVSVLALGWSPAQVPDAVRAGQAAPQPQSSPPAGGDAAKRRSVIILWMTGGPSQFETFDPKPGAFFDPIDTSVKGLQISKTLPRLAKQAHHLAILRTLNHREGDHARGSHLMRTGYGVDGTDYPSLAAILGKELGHPDRPRFISIAPVKFERAGWGPGFLGNPYGPMELSVHGNVGTASFALPDVGAFEAVAKGKGEAHRQVVEKALDLKHEKPDLIAAYGPTPFGQGCLVARRLVEQGVPVVEVTLPGWDMHQDVAGTMPKVAAALDGGLATLLQDLHDRWRLNKTLVVCMGEFGRTPRVNGNGGRDHWPKSFSVVLAGAGIEGGRAIGKTSNDGATIDERPVSPAELMATICAAVGVDATKTNLDRGGRAVPIVEKGAEAVKEALR